MGVCCIVFDIDGAWIFYEFYNFKNYFVQNFMLSWRFMLFPTFNKKFGVQKICGVGNFFRKTSHFTFYAIFNIKKKIEKCPFTYWLNGRWFLQIVERDSWNLYPLYPLFPCSDFVSQMWGGGVMFFSHFMLFPTFLEKNIWEYKTIISHLMFSLCFFVCWKYWKVVKWEVVSPNSRYREFYHEIGNIEKCPFTYWLNGGDGFSKL